MLGMNRWSPFDEIFNVQREVDRMFSQFWDELPRRSQNAAPGGFQVNATEDGWRIDIPLPGVDPQHVNLEAAGSTLSIRVEEPVEGQDSTTKVTRYEQAFTIPPFLDAEKLSASHRHGLLRLTLPLKESVKPRRIQIQHAAEEQKQLTAV